MRAMKRNTDRNMITADGGIAERGLPSVRYRPAAAATLAAAVVVLLVLFLLTVAGVLNVTSFATNEQSSEGAAFGAIFCGLLTLLALVGTGYFTLAVVRGVRDLGASVYYTRGCIPEGDRGGRRNSWLVIEPEYAGPDMERATGITDEQKAASVDRAQIFQPRFAGAAEHKREKD